MYDETRPYKVLQAFNSGLMIPVIAELFGVDDDEVTAIIGSMMTLKIDAVI